MKTAVYSKEDFIVGSGEMADLIRNKDWSKSPIGSPDTWPSVLKTTLNLIINCKFPMFIWWGDDLICFYNDAYRPSLGKNGKHPRILGMKAEEAWPEIWSIISPLIKEVLEGNSTWFEDRLVPIYRNGKIEDVYWTFSYSPIYDEGERPSGVLVTCTETTDKIHYLKELTESKNELKFAIDAADLATWDLNPKTNIFRYNDRLKEWFGLDANEDVALAQAIKAIAPGDRDRVANSIAHALQYSSGGNYDIEYNIINKKTGRERIIKAKGRALFDSNELPEKFSGILMDITEQVKANNKIKESEDQFRTLANNIQNLAWMANADGWIYWYNNRWYEYTGTNHEDMKGWGWQKVHHPDYVEQVVNFVKKAWKENKPWELTFPLKSKDGSYHWFLTRAYPVCDSEGNIVRWIGTNTDIDTQISFTEKLEQKVKERTEELNNQKDLLKQQNFELEKMNNDLASFAYISSHDLQEPLRKIQMFSKRILQIEYNNLSDQGANYFKRMEISANRMQQLINDLLSYSKTSASEKNFQLTDLNVILNEVLDEMSETITSTNTKIKATGLPEIYTIPFQLKQLFTNIISNSIKFARKDVSPEIEISCTVTDSTISNKSAAGNKYYQLSFKDNGIGFEPEFSEKIFGMFQRLEGRSSYEGTGIGLSIVKKIVENHNGYVSAIGEKNKGIILNVYLPVSISHSIN